MVLGTASHVGKSVLTAAFCRILANRGLRVAPFKAQNMALNSAATPEGLEIGRAQAMQAEACRIPASVDMNPILIKPMTDVGAQIVVAGRIWRTATAADFHRNKIRELFPLVCETFARLAAAHDIVVLEGAGSPAEINLKAGDLVNMRMAEAADAACVLVGDIDRGGVFASLVGTMALLEPEERARIRGFVINKFRGDVSLLTPGIRMIEERIDIPCVGVVPHIPDLGLDEEDSVSLEDRRIVARAWPPTGASDRDDDDRPLRVGVVALPHMANFTDFDPLAREPSIALAYLTSADDVARADTVVLPGTKQTLDDLAWLESRGFAAAIRAHATRGGLTMGVCGGMQMLGRRISDPEGIEGGGARDGLDLLAIETTMARHKVTVRSRGRLCEPWLFGEPMTSQAIGGYEIHVGLTRLLDGTSPFARLEREHGATRMAAAAAGPAVSSPPSPRVASAPAESATAAAQAAASLRSASRPASASTRVEGSHDDRDIVDGAQSADGRVVGTYLHGVFDDDEWRHAWIGAARAACGLAPAERMAFVALERDGRFERLAAIVERSCDIGRMLAWLK